MNESKLQICKAVDQAAEDLKTLALNIHHNPELGFKEYKAMNFIADTLEQNGFEVSRGYCGVETSFKAFKKGKQDGPTVCFLAEYDALNGVGHGCGHNLIAACSTGAFIGLGSIMDQLEGNICIIGTPAEETASSKVTLLADGAFEGVDYAMMMHPTVGGTKSNLVGRGGRASSDAFLTFHGKGAHSSVPYNGINALSALINVFNQIDLMRPTFHPQDNINGIITAGGTAPNIIPSLASAEFCVRADTMHRIEELLAIMEKCVKNAEALTGAKAEFHHGVISAERYPNKPMNQAFKDNMAELGVEMVWPDPKKQYGSSDIGNLSIVMPIIHDYLSISDDTTIQSHTVEYAAAAETPQALETMIKGAKGLAMTAYDILSSESFRQEIKEYFDQQIPAFYKK